MQHTLKESEVLFYNNRHSAVPVNICEKDCEYKVNIRLLREKEADEEISVEVAESFVTITSLRFGQNVYEKTFYYPYDIDTSKIKSDCTDGIVKLKLPKLCYNLSGNLIYEGSKS